MWQDSRIAVTSADTVVIESVLTRADWSALQTAATERARARIGRVRLLGATALPVVAGVLLTVTISGPSPFASLIPLAAVLGGLAWAKRLLRSASLPHEDGLFL